MDTTTHTIRPNFSNHFDKVFLHTNSLPFGKVLDGSCRIRAHGEEANEWRLWIAFFPGGLQVQYHPFSVLLAHGICNVFAGLMQCTVRTPRSGIKQFKTRTQRLSLEDMFRILQSPSSVQGCLQIFDSI